MQERIGRFTSSQIHKIMKQPARGNNPFLQSGLTYIRQKFLERKIGRSLEVPTYGQAMAWGRFMEAYLLREHLGMKYRTTSRSTIVSDQYPDHLAGTPDFEHYDNDVVTTCEVKCFYPEKWAELGLDLQSGDIERIKQNQPEIYWQVVCNAYLLGSTRCEILSFMPSIDELVKVKDLAEDPMFIEENDLGDMWQYRFIYERDNLSLPYVAVESEIKPLERFCFDVPADDFKFLKERIEAAIEVFKEMEK